MHWHRVLCIHQVGLILTTLKGALSGAPPQPVCSWGRRWEARTSKALSKHDKISFLVTQRQAGMTPFCVDALCLRTEPPKWLKRNHGPGQPLHSDVSSSKACSTQFLQHLLWVHTGPRDVGLMSPTPREPTVRWGQAGSVTLL